MARRRRGRAIDGVILLDKPKGYSSNGLLQKVRWLYQAQKAGHTGALDPAATGLLPICLGEATKFTRFLLDANKRYVTTGVLGVETDTLDAEGNIVNESAVPIISSEDIQAVINKSFIGDIMQVPPMYSALKRDGKKLYELAREGKTIAIEPRPVSLFHNNVLNFESPEFELDVHCSKGTYIRTLVADIGSAFGCGAHVRHLRRTEHGKFNIDQACKLDEVEQLREAEDFLAMDAKLISISELLSDLPRIDLNERYTQLFSHGNDIQMEEVPAEVRVYGYTGDFLGVGRVTENARLQPERLVALSNQ